MLDEFWTAFETGDNGRLRALLHDDVAFASPAFAEATTGGDRVARVLGVARGLYDDLTLTHRYDDPGGGGALFFTARVAGEPIQGVYRIDADGPLATRVEALFRPVDATRALVGAMMERLS